MSSEGVSPKLRVLYVPDYISCEQRLAATSSLYIQLSRALAGYDVQLALAESPFEDHDGISAHFDRDALGRVQGPTQIA